MLYFYVASRNAAARRMAGAGMAEYALLLALIAVVCIVGFRALGGAINTRATNVGTDVTNA